MSDELVVAVFEEWQQRQSVPARCKLTEARKRLIRARLKDHPVSDLRALIRYAYEADDPGPRFWRGENRDGRTYLGLDNLFRASKVDDRIESAVAWMEDGEPPDLDLAGMGAFRGQAVVVADTDTDSNGDGFTEEALESMASQAKRSIGRVPKRRRRG